MDANQLKVVEVYWAFILLRLAFIFVRNSIFHWTTHSFLHLLIESEENSIYYTYPSINMFDRKNFIFITAQKIGTHFFQWSDTWRHINFVLFDRKKCADLNHKKKNRNFKNNSKADLDLLIILERHSQEMKKNRFESIRSE